MAEPYNSFVMKHYQISENPGYFEGVSSSVVSGYNIGINKFIENDKEKVKAAIKLVEYATSLDIQKYLFENGASVPAIDSIFDDEEICETKPCELYKYIQRFKKSDVDITKIPDYNEQFYSYSCDYLYGNETVDNTINRLDSLTMTYYISLDISESYIGLIGIIIISVISLIMLFSLVFIFRDNFIPYFKFLPTYMWILVIIGTIMILCSALTNIGRITEEKCDIQIILFLFGYTLIMVPLFCQLICNFPDKNKFSKWTKKHRYIYVIFFVIVDTIIFSFSQLKSYSKVIQVIDEEIDGRKNFEKCKINYDLGIKMVLIDVIIKLIILFISVILIFIEWNIEKSFYEIRFITYAIYSNILLIPINIFVNNNKYINNYKLLYILKITFIIIISLSNYLFLYGFKLIIAFMNKKNVKLDFINRINDNFINNEDTSISKSTVENEKSNYYSKCITTCDNNTNIEGNGTNIKSNILNKGITSEVSHRSVLDKIMDYHYTTSIDENNEDIQESVFSNVF